MFSETASPSWRNSPIDYHLYVSHDLFVRKAWGRIIQRFPNLRAHPRVMDCGFMRAAHALGGVRALRTRGA